MYKQHVARARSALLVGLALSICVLSCAVAASAPVYDIVIANGRVMDPESGLDAVRHVGVDGGKVVALSAARLEGRRTIEARDLVVAPGFIDLNRHAQDPENDAIAARDGVTTSLQLEIGTVDVDAWYATRVGRSLINFGVSAGHVQARMAVKQEAAGLLPSGLAAHQGASAVEIEQMQALLRRALDRGALAVGIAPTYTPAASQLEVVNMFRVAAEYRAPVHMHIRARLEVPEGHVAGMQEALAAALVTGAPLHVVHVQSTSGPNVADELRMIEAARERGLDVTTEAYPYSRGQSAIQSALYDGKENAPDSFFATLIWAQTGEVLTRETFLRYRQLGGTVIDQATTEEHMRLAVAHPLTMVASDGRISNGKGHPRAAGTHARVLGRHVRDEAALSLMEALRKMTLMPARRLEARAPMMRHKGRIHPGADADIVIFEHSTIVDMATFQQPTLPSRGIRHVIVNGVVIVDAPRTVTGVFPGVAVRAPTP